jgi:N-acetylglucosamine kinase-like BadF-type ATPase
MLDAYNGLGDATILTQLMLDMYKQPDVLTMYRKITKSELGYKVYDFCPLLMRAAKEGDTVALRILNASGERMARYIEEGAKKLDISDETISLVLTGGVFKGDGSIFFDIINNIIQKKGLNIVCIPARYEPVAGTALLFFDGLEENERAVALRRFEASPRVGAVRYNK